MITVVDDCQKFPIKSLVPTRRRRALGDPAEKQYFGSTRGVFAGLPWLFDADQLSLKMGATTWPIVVRRNVHGTRTFVRGSNGRLYTCLLVVNGRVGTRDTMKYRSQDYLSPRERAEWKKSKHARRSADPRELNEKYSAPASYGEARAPKSSASRSVSGGPTHGPSSRATKAPEGREEGTMPARKSRVRRAKSKAQAANRPSHRRRTTKE